MKNAILFHGTSSSPNSFWFPYIKKELEGRGYVVSIPRLPNTDYPDLKTWLSAALKEDVNQDSVLIGHSAGAPLILSLLEIIDVKVKQVILVSGYAREKGENPQPKAILQATYNWEKIKSNSSEFIFINSDNDPWGCNDLEGRHLLDNLGGTLIIRKGEGHMGSDSFNQPYLEFPFLVKLTD